MYVPLWNVPRYDDPLEASWGVVRVDQEKCTGCNLCVRACPSNVLFLDAKKAQVRSEGVVQCMACAACTAICPDHAVELLESYRFTGAYATRDRGSLQLPRL